jgi:tRNA (guanosine-2'-O-)-methyltransferase
VRPDRITRLRAVLDKRQPDLTLVTDFVHTQRDTSAIIRNCDAVGIMIVHAWLISAITRLTVARPWGPIAG